ncbi:hypothetical protein QL285_059577 [Trifolium repens]|nr:hypothetical protein QL285_059577 [Trifolium repens]
MEITGLVPLVGENYVLKLKNSMQDISSEISKESPDFSLFVDTFYELMQTKVDPPFDVIWVYAAIKFGCRKSVKVDTLDQISAAKELFQLVSACSASVGGSKSVALLAPVVFMIHSVVKELFGKELRLKREKKAMKEVKSLVDLVLGYMSICCSKISDEENLDLVLSFNDLACLWLVDTNVGFESLLPLVSSDVCGWVCEREFHVGYLGGAVMMEVFFLKLCLSFSMELPRDELEMNLKIWSVGSISSFQNVYFFELLMRTVLETSLPLNSILKPEDEILLRKVLFDDVLLVDYPFLYQNANYIKSLALTRLIITHDAVEYFRELDHNRVVSYIKAFTSSHTPSQIIKLVSSENGIEENAVKANGSSPKALINWLLRLENRGIRVFEDDTLKSHAKLCLDISQLEQPVSTLDGKVTNDGLFYVDNAGDEENVSEEDKENKLISDAFVAAAQTMKSSDNESRKRKAKSSGKNIKFAKYELNQNTAPVKAGTSAPNDSSSDESEVQDPNSDSDA